MAELERLSTVVCHDLAETLIDETALEAELREAVEDGSICRTVGAQLLDLVHEVEQSTHVAYVGAERSDEVLANFSYFLKRGMGTVPHQYLRERRRDVDSLAVRMCLPATTKALGAEPKAFGKSSDRSVVGNRKATRK